MEFYLFCGYLASFFFAFCYIPQIKHTLKTKKADDISYTFQFMSLIAGISALIFALHTQHLNLIIGTIIETIFIILLIYLKYKYSNLDNSIEDSTIVNDQRIDIVES